MLKCENGCGPVYPCPGCDTSAVTPDIEYHRREIARLTKERDAALAELAEGLHGKQVSREANEMMRNLYARTLTTVLESAHAAGRREGIEVALGVGEKAEKECISEWNATLLAVVNAKIRALLESGK